MSQLRNPHPGEILKTNGTGGRHLGGQGHISGTRKRKPVRHPRRGQIPALLGTRDTLIAWRMSRAFRTDEIARVLNVSEAEVANSLHRLRELIHNGYSRRIVLYPQQAIFGACHVAPNAGGAHGSASLSVPRPPHPIAENVNG